MCGGSDNKVKPFEEGGMKKGENLEHPYRCCQNSPNNVEFCSNFCIPTYSYKYNYHIMIKSTYDIVKYTCAFTNEYWQVLLFFCPPLHRDQV